MSKKMKIQLTLVIALAMLTLTNLTAVGAQDSEVTPEPSLVSAPLVEFNGITMFVDGNGDVVLQTNAGMVTIPTPTGEKVQAMQILEAGIGVQYTNNYTSWTFAQAFTGAEGIIDDRIVVRSVQVSPSQYCGATVIISANTENSTDYTIEPMLYGSPSGKMSCYDFLTVGQEDAIAANALLSFGVKTVIDEVKSVVDGNYTIDIADGVATLKFNASSFVIPGLALAALIDAENEQFAIQTDKELKVWTINGFFGNVEPVSTPRVVTSTQQISSRFYCAAVVTGDNTGNEMDVHVKITLFQLGDEKENLPECSMVITQDDLDAAALALQFPPNRVAIHYNINDCNTPDDCPINNGNIYRVQVDDQSSQIQKHPTDNVWAGYEISLLGDINTTSDYILTSKGMGGAGFGYKEGPNGIYLLNLAAFVQ